MSFGPRRGSAADCTADPDLDAAASLAHEFFVDGLAAGKQLADWQIAAALLGQASAIRARTDAEHERAAYGPGGREHFGDPRPGDFPGRGAAGAETELEAEAG